MGDVRNVEIHSNKDSLALELEIGDRELRRERHGVLFQLMFCCKCERIVKSE